MRFTEYAASLFEHKLFLPKELMDVPRWHVEQQIPERIGAESDLLFPSETGGFRSRSVLDRPFGEVGEAMGAGGMEVVRIDPKNENGQLGSNSHLADSA